MGVVNMGQRVLVLDDATRALIQKVRAFAEAREHWYRPTPGEFKDARAGTTASHGNPSRPGNHPTTRSTSARTTASTVSRPPTRASSDISR